MTTSQTANNEVVVNLRPTQSTVSSEKSDKSEMKVEAVRNILASHDTELAKQIIKNFEGDFILNSTPDETAAENINENSTNTDYTETMIKEQTIVNNDKKSVSSMITDRTLLWTILGAVISFYALMITIVYSSNSQNVTTMQAIREETVAKVSGSNEKVVYELQGLRSDMQNLRSDINQKLEMQDLKTENKILKEKSKR